MKAILRYWWIIASGTLVLTFIGLGSYRYLLYSASQSQAIMALVSIVCAILLFASFVGVGGSFIAVQFLVFARFYKHFFTDEGYLTFTLPISRKSLLLSKTLSSVIWTTAHTVLVAVCSVFLIIGMIPKEEGIVGVIGNTVKELWFRFGAWLIAYVFVGLILCIATIASSVIIVQFCITIGSVIVKKAKILAAIGIYYAFNSVISLVGQVLSSAISVVGTLIVSRIPIDSQLGHVLILLTLLLLIVIVCAISATMYFWTLGTLERKLNLP
jgi:hypothetical protein